MRGRPGYDIIVIGATGFTGSLVAEYLTKVAATRCKEVRFAIVGRNPGKLKALQSKLQDMFKQERLADARKWGVQSNPGIIVADVTDQQSVDNAVR